jgi:Protein of unknown function (DUF2510)
MTMTGQAAQGWYPDPSDQRQLRWFDGAQWTDRVHSAAQPAAYAAPQAYSTPTYTQPQYVQEPSSGCQVCAAVPAMDVKLREHHGMILIQRFLTHKGRFCRDCGLAKFRVVQKKTLVHGWWGYISFFVNWVNAAQNLVVWRQLRSLGAPTGRRGTATPAGSSVLSSAGMAITVAIPFLWIWIFITH